MIFILVFRSFLAQNLNIADKFLAFIDQLVLGVSFEILAKILSDAL